MDNKKTCLYDRHLALGAKMVPFGGFEMPLQYTDITDEHNSVRTSCGVFDVSHMGEVVVEAAFHDFHKSGVLEQSVVPCCVLEVEAFWVVDDFFVVFILIVAKRHVEVPYGSHVNFTAYGTMHETTCIEDCVAVFCYLIDEIPFHK